MTFQPLFSLWVVLPAFLLLLAGLSWLEVQRAGRWRGARLAALALALLAILGMVLQPSRERVLQEDPLLLLTSGFRENTADSLLRAHPDWAAIRTPSAPDYRKSKAMKDLVELRPLSHRIAAIHGDGLPAYGFEHFREYNYQYFPVPESGGFSELYLSTYTAGSPGRIAGVYRPTEKQLSLLLRGPAGDVDSISMNGNSQQIFSLNFLPKQAGRWSYELLLKDSTGRVLSQNALPIVVHPEKQLRVLFLQAFPSFEVRYLKDFLADRGHAVAVRTQISRNNYRTEFANLPALDLNRLNAALLENFDLLIADAAAYGQLNRTALNELEEAIENGLGFLGLVNAEGAAFRNWLGLTGIGNDADTVRLDNGLNLNAFPVRIRSDREWYTVQQTPIGRVVSAYHYQGKGKIGFQAVPESYSYLLRGDSLAYATLWMPVLEGALREEYPDYTIELLNDLPVYAGEPLDFRVIANEPVATVFADGDQVPLLEDPTLDDIWYGRMWPASPGWHRLEAGEERLDFYAFPAEEWADLRMADLRKQAMIRAQPEPNVNSLDREAITLEPVSRIWMFVLFLLSAGFLWLAPKLGGSGSAVHGQLDIVQSHW